MTNRGSPTGRPSRDAPLRQAIRPLRDPPGFGRHGRRYGTAPVGFEPEPRADSPAIADVVGYTIGGGGWCLWERGVGLLDSTPGSLANPATPRASG